MKTLKGALIGFGQVAEKAHMPAWRDSDDFEIVAIVDEKEDRRKIAANESPDARIYRSIEELFQNETSLDFVDIATPPALHTRQACISLQRGCHVISEKPLCLKPQNFESIRALSLYENRAVFDTHNWKYAPLFQKVAGLIHTGSVGTVHHVELHTLRQGPSANAGQGTWRTDPIISGGGILVDHGWHNFYLIQAFLGKNPRAISSLLSIPRPHGVEDEAHCVIQYPNATAALHMTWRSPIRHNWGLVYGSEGMIEMRDDHVRLTKKDGAHETFRFGEKISESSAHPKWFKAMLPDFKIEIENQESRYQNLRETQTCLLLLTHAYESHRFGGKTISLPSSAALSPLDPSKAGRGDRQFAIA